MSSFVNSEYIDVCAEWVGILLTHKLWNSIPHLNEKGDCPFNKCMWTFWLLSIFLGVFRNITLTKNDRYFFLLFLFPKIFASPFCYQETVKLKGQFSWLVSQYLNLKDFVKEIKVAYMSMSCSVVIDWYRKWFFVFTNWCNP